jgi:8-oxo-dGTP pyrophosphatase MutT (NUDIX family)
MIRETALRELTEETGYSLLPRWRINLSGTLLFIAKILRRDAPSVFGPTVRATGFGRKPEDSESIVESREYSLDDLRSMIAENLIQDANTLALYARLAAKKLIS